MLAGPVPAYPELLRQAGVQGRVVLEAVIDTAGHVEPGSLVVVAAAHPGFVAAAQQAVAATLFRPARARAGCAGARAHPHGLRTAALAHKSHGAVIVL